MSDDARTFVALAADKLEDGKQWIEVLPTADKVRNGPWYFSITASDLETYAEYIRQNAERLPVDYDHAGDRSDGSTVAAGWFTGQAEVRNTDQGERLFAEVEWTPQAQEEIGSRRYRFISAVFNFAKKDAKTGLMTKARQFVAATLTNRPFFKELSPVAHDLFDSDQLDALAAVHGQPFVDLALAALDTGDGDTIRPIIDAILASLPKENTQMSDKNELAVLATALGLSEDADEATITAAIKAKDDAIAALEAKVLPEDEVKNLVTQAAQGAQAKKELDELKVATMLDKAIADGKILPAQRDAYATMAVADFAGVKTLIDATPEKALAHLSEAGSGGDNDADDDNPASEKHVTAASKRYESAAADGVDEETVAVDLKARAHLIKLGKDPDTCTAAELVAAYEAVGYTSSV